MASQGIQVSIQAKIEGWQEQIKQIQNAMKNIKPGADISKSLVKDLDQVNRMVENLGRNMTQHLTSDSQITSFIDKMMDVERVFDRIGSSMQNVSFGDLQPEYITANFQDLLSAIEKANTALGTEMQSSFQTAIADSDKLQRVFKELKIDPKEMNIDSLRDALNSKGSSLQTDLQNAWKEADKLHNKMSVLTEEKRQLESRQSTLGDDAQETAKRLLGSYTDGTILDKDALKQKKEEIRQGLFDLGFNKTEIAKQIFPTVDECLAKGEWDKLSTKLAGHISKAQSQVSTELLINQRDYRNTKQQWQFAQGTAMTIGNQAGRVNEAQSELQNIINSYVEQAVAPLKQEIANLKAQLEGKATESLHTLGGATKQSSAQGMQETAAAAKDYSAALEQVKASEAMVGKIQGVVQRWFSVYAVVRMVTNAIKKAGKVIQELDTTMTEISIVTKMSQADLWQQMPKYTKMARDYASSIKGVYEVSQIYYQQGLEMNDVMALTESTLKMARISGLGYSEAADYMTNAIRSFKMEMTDANRVVDVYSAVAASSASNVTELATAMSKTASSAQAVGSSFENTTAMLAVMIEATRESPENIGSAMKSIISRYGELKENKTGIDEEGEEYSLNKVDKALQTVGISIHDAKGEFRDFDDVIMELSEHWNEIDKNTQRYIATVMAGNRQQSRFLALVSSYDRLKEESAKATNSEDAAQLQFLKSLDSIDAKKQQLETSIQSIYTNSGIENLYKRLLDFSNNILITFDNLSSESGLGAAVAKIGATFMTLATLVTHAFTLIKQRLAMSNAELTAQIKADALAQQMGYESAAQARTALNDETIAKLKADESAYTEFLKAENDRRLQQDMKKQQLKRGLKTGAAMAASMAGLAITTTAANLDVNQDRQKKANLTALGGILSGIGTGFMIGGIPGAIVGTLTAIPSIIEAIGLASESVAEKVERLQKNIDDTKNETLKSQSEVKTLQEYKEKYDELKKSRYDSIEAEKKYKELIQEIGEAYPELIKSMDVEGNYILDMSDAYTKLIETKTQAYSEDFINQLSTEYAALQDIDYILEKIYNISPEKSTKNILGWSISNIDKLSQYYKESFLDTETPTFVGKRSEGIGDTGFQTFTKVMSSKNTGVLNDLFFPNLDSIIVPDWYNYKNNDIGIGILAKIYDSYKQSVEKELTYEEAKIEARKLTFDEFINPETAGYTEYMKMASNAIEYFGTKIEKTVDGEEKITAPGYERFQAVYGALKDNEKLIDSMYDVEIGKYLNTLGTSYTTTTGDTISDFQSFIIKNNLISDLSTYMAKNYNKVKNKEQYEVNGQKYTYDEKKLISDYYEENKIDTNWYKDQIEALPNIPDAIESIYKNIGKIGSSQLESELRASAGNLDEKTIQFLLEKLQAAQEKSYDAIVKNYDKWATEGIDENIVNDNTRNLIKNFGKIFGPEYLEGIQSQYKQILQSSLSDTQKREQITALTNLYDTISTNKELSFTQKGGILQNLAYGDLTTVTGINDAINYIQNLNLGSVGDAIISSLKDVESNLNINFVTEFSNFSNNIIKQSQNFEKAISNATKGMDLKSASEMADKMGKTLKDFSYKDGKYYYENLSDIDEAYLSYDDQLLESLTQKKNDTINMLQDFTLTKFSEETFDPYKINDVYLKEWQTSLKQAGYNVENGKIFGEHLVSSTTEFFDITKEYEEGYLESWEEEILEAGFSSLEEFRALGKADIKTLGARDKKVQNLRRIFDEVELTEISDADLITLKGLSKTESIDIEQIIQDYGNDVEEVVKAINSDEFAIPKNINKDSLIGYVRAFMSRTGDDLNLGWNEWIEQYLNEIYEANKTVIDEYRKDQKARTYLSNGDIKGFVNTIRGTKSEDYQKYYEEALAQGIDESGANYIAKMQVESAQRWNKENEQIIDAIASGDASKLSTEDQEKYGKLIRDTYKGISSSFIDAVFTAMDGGTTALEITKINQKYLQDIKTAHPEWITGDIQVGKQIELAMDQITADEEELWKIIQNSYDNEKDRLEAFKNYHDKKYSKNKLTALESITDGEIAYSDFLDYLTTNRGWTTEQLFTGNRLASETKAYGLAMTAAGDYVVENWSQYIAQLGDDLNYLLENGITKSGQKATVQDINRARAAVQTAQRGQQTAIENAASDILDNYDNISIEQQEALANALGKDLGSEEIQQFFKEVNGKTKLDLEKFKEYSTLFSDEIQAVLADQFSSITDELLGNIKDASSLATSGTSSKADIQAFKAKMQELGMIISDSDFSYDAVLDAWTLDPQVLHTYVENQASQLVQAKMLTEQQALQYLNKNVTEVLFKNIDIQSFLEDENWDVGDSKAQLLFRKQLKQAGLDESMISTIVSNLLEGGAASVATVSEIARLQGRELTSSEIETAYRSQISRIEEALDQITFGPGGIVSGYAVDILRTLAENNQANITLLDGGTSAVINSITDISAAYAEYYKQLAESGEATLAALNEAKAKILETQGGRYKEQAAIDALGDAAGMTYTSFAAILSDAGIEMTDDIIAEYTESLGGNRMRIKDFTSFARRMGWNFDSEEYTGALKTYNDGLIEQNTKIKDNITEELQGLEDIKPGDWLNLTETTKAFEKYAKANKKDRNKELREARTILKGMQDSNKGAIDDQIKQQEELIESLESQDFIESLQNSLVKFGAYLDDGILKIQDEANILGIAQTLQQYTQEAGLDIGNEFADMVQNIINSYTDAITGGIEGGLTNVDAANLRKIASNLGIEGLDFNETAEGLQLTQKSAIELYHIFSQTNKLGSKKAFDSLSKILEENNEKYKTTTSLLSHIADLQQQINKAQGEGNDSRVKQLEAELALAKQINAQRLIQGEADWNFMNNRALPGSFTNAIEYWQGWAQASKTLNEAAQKQKIDPETLATMFQHVYEIAETTNKSIEFMGLSTDKMNMTELLDALGSIVEIDAKTGEAILSAQNLRKLGIELGLGANGISTGLKDATEEYAKINAEQLQKIHDFYNNLADIQDALTAEGIDWNTFFNEISGEFNYNKFKNELSKQEKALKAFENFAKTVSIGESKLSDLLGPGTGTLDAQTSKTIMSIFKMMSSDDWDASTGYQTIMEHLSSSGFQGSLDLGDMQFQVSGNHVLYKTKESKEWTTPEGKKYSKAEDALHQMQMEDLADFAEQYSQSVYEKQSSLEQYQFPGEDYTIVVDGDHYKIVKGKDVIADNINTNEELENTIFTQAKENADQERKTALDYMTTEGYMLSQQRKNKAYKPQNYVNSIGQINTNVRSKIQSSGFDSAQAIRERAEALWTESGLSSEEAAAQFYIETGIDIDPSIAKNQIQQKLDEIDIEDIFKQTELTQAAADVAAGITTAFTAKGDNTVSQAISSSIRDSLVSLEDDANKVKIPLEIDPSKAKEAIDQFKDTTIKPTVEWKHINTDPGIQDLHKTVHWTHEEENSPPSGGNGVGNSTPNVPHNYVARQAATGTIGLAHAKSTLMGELGPELVVSNNKYFVAGQNGPEFVDLDTDAIVFNHLQTQSLLTKGTSNTRGRAITNERNAVAYAKGSRMGGPARSSVRQAAIDTSPGGVIWSNGFKGIKGGKNDDKDKDIKAFIKELERWYNWLQEIARIEKEINYEEALRSRLSSDYIKNGYEYYNSQKRTLSLLKDQLDTQLDLNRAQKEYLADLQRDLTSDQNPFSALFTWDAYGQLKYRNGKFAELSNLGGADRYNNPNFTAKEQYEYLTGTLGISDDFFLYDKSGNKIDREKDKDNWYATAMQAYWDKADKWQQEYQETWDSIEEGMTKAEELLSQQNELLQEMRDNQMDLEKQVYDAIVEIRERIIKELEDTKDALQDQNEKYIQGLSDALQKEQDMFNNADQRKDLDKLQRQRDILVRSGGSAAEIASLNEEISEKERELYLDKQQQQIDAIQEASDKQIEKLEAQIQVETEILEYQKQFGLLWAQVTEIMSQSPEEIANFITQYSAEYWNQSPTKHAEELQKLIFSTEKWVGYRDDGGALFNDVDLIRKKVYGETDEEKNANKNKTGNNGNGNGNEGSPSGNKSSGAAQIYRVRGKEFTNKKEAQEYLKQQQEVQTGIVNTLKDTDSNVPYQAQKAALLKEQDEEQRWNSTQVETVKVKNISGWQSDASNHWKVITYSDDTSGKINQSPHSINSKTGKCSICKYQSPVKSYLISANKGKSSVSSSVSTDDKAKQEAATYKSLGYTNVRITPQYAKGGMNYETGLAMLHGTSQNPEAVLNAEQTRILRENILSKSPNSLVNLLKSYNEAYKGLSSSTYDSISNNNSTQIDKAEINLHIDQLANDYDSRQAANTIMDEMLRIASKTSANNSVRR